MGAGGGGLSRDALKNMPPAARKPYIWLAAIWASYNGGLHSFNTSNISGIMKFDPFIKEFGWTNISDDTKSNYQGWVVSSMILVRIPYPTVSYKPLLTLFASPRVRF